FANDGTTRRYVARLNSDGSLDNSFNFNPDPADAYLLVKHVALEPDGKMVIGALQISPVSHRSRPIINRLNTDGSLDSSFVTTSAGDESILYAMALQPDNRILVGGNFGSGHAMLLRVNADGGLDSTFSWGTAGGASDVFSLGVQSDGKVLVGGSFLIGTFSNGFVSSFCRLNADGSLDSSFDPVP